MPPFNKFQNNQTLQTKNFDSLNMDEASVGAKIDYDFLLLRQINRIAMMLSSIENGGYADDFINSVEALHYMLSSYLDSEYNIRLKILQLKYQLALERMPSEQELENRNSSQDHLQRSMEIEFAKKKWELLMKLQNRRAFLPQKEVIDFA